MKKFIFYLIQFTWALPQNLIGLLVYLCLYKKCTHERFHNSFISYVNNDNFGGISIGIFIFMNPKRDKKRIHDTKIHEYGHTIQSLFLGPVWVLIIAIPSVIWCNLKYFRELREQKNISYYTLYCEGWANIWGRYFSKEDFISEDFLLHANYGKPIKPIF